jgi:hypothetical protein
MAVVPRLTLSTTTSILNGFTWLPTHSIYPSSMGLQMGWASMDCTEMLYLKKCFILLWTIIIYLRIHSYIKIFLKFFKFKPGYMHLILHWKSPFFQSICVLNEVITLGLVVKGHMIKVGNVDYDTQCRHLATIPVCSV